MNLRPLMLPLAVLLGAVAGYFFGSASAAAPERLPEPRRERPKRAIAATENSLTEESLRARIAELEQALADAARRSVPVVTNAVSVHGGPRRPGWGRMHERMEQLRKEDPARYAQMTNDFAQRFKRDRAARAAQEKSRRAFLAALSTDGMTETESQVHEQLQKALSEHDRLRERMRDRDMTDEEREELHKALRETGDSIRELGKQERDTLLRKTADALGLSDDSVDDFSEAVKAIFEATETSRGPGGDMPPPPPDVSPEPQ